VVKWGSFSIAMALKLRPTGLGPGSTRSPRLHCLHGRVGLSAAFTKPAAAPSICAGSGRLPFRGPMTRSDRVATFEEAKAQFQKSWDEWKAWAKLNEVP
jgi:hypothetical protein